MAVHNAQHSTGSSKPESTRYRIVAGILGHAPLLILILLLCSLPYFIYIMVELSPRVQVVLSLGLILVGQVVVLRFPRHRLIIVFLSMAASLRYLLYRFQYTLAFDSAGDGVATTLLLLAECYALITLLTGYFQTAILRRHRPVYLDMSDPDLPTVDIFIPTYNETVDVVRPTVMGALATTYPEHKRKVWVLDDGRRPEMKAMAEALGANYLTREDNRGAKAGNINRALEQTDGELIAIFDADHIPVRGFLDATVGFFMRNDKLALVQTPHHFYNPDPFIRNLHLEGIVPPEQHLFYHGIQLGNDFWNSAFFCGSCALLRRTALDEVGGVAQETVTEDAHTALKLHGRGWDSLYLDIPLAAGLATETYAFHVGQRIRWARGMAQIFRLDNPLLKRGLSLPQRINYFNASWHFFAGIPRLIFLLVPPIFLVFKLHPLDANVWEVLVFALPHLVLASLGAATLHRNVRHSLWAEVYEVAVAPYTAAVTTLAMFAPRRGKFNVTTKGTTFTDYAFDYRHAAPLVFFLLFVIAGLVAIPIRWLEMPTQHDTIIVAGFWNLYNLVILLTAIFTAQERPQRRSSHRLKRRAPVRVSPCPRGASFKPFMVESVDLSLGGIALRMTAETPPLPARFQVSVRSSADMQESSPMTVEVLERLPAKEDMIYRARFVDLDSTPENELPYQLFSGTDTWTRDEFAYDRYGRSIETLLLALVNAIFRNPRWLARLRRQTEETFTMLPEAGPKRCPACAAPQPDDAISCSFCNQVLPRDASSDQLAVPLAPAPRRRGLRPWLNPLLVASCLLAFQFGWSPDVGAFHQYLPPQRWDVTTIQTRQPQLIQACYELDQLTRQLERSLRGQRPLPPEWSGALWSTRYSRHLVADPSPTSPHMDEERALRQAVQLLDDGARLQRQGGDPAKVSQALRQVKSLLARVREGLDAQ